MKAFNFDAAATIPGRDKGAFDKAIADGEPIKAIFKAYEYLVSKIEGGWLVSYCDGYPIAVATSPEGAMEKITAMIEASEKADALMEKAAKAAGVNYAQAIDALPLEGDKELVGRLKKAKKSEMAEQKERERFAASLAEREFEVLSAGTWNKRTFTLEDLTKIVANTKARLDYLKPTLKLGHDDDQALAKSAGLPACGWMTDLRLDGEKVVATFAGIPEGLNKLLGKAWKRVSCELLFGWRDPETGSKMTVMSAVALLGEELPAVTNLADIAALYGEEWTAAQDRFVALIGGNPFDFASTLSGERVQFTYPKEEPVEKTEPKPETVSKEAFAASLETIKGLQSQIAEAQARETDRAKLSASERIDAALESAVAEARIVPAQKDGLSKLFLKAADEHVKITMSAKPGEKVESTLDLMLAELKSRPAMKALFREIGRDILPEPEGETITEDKALEMAAQMEKAEKITWREAYAKVRSMHQVQKSAPEISESGARE